MHQLDIISSMSPLDVIKKKNTQVKSQKRTNLENLRRAWSAPLSEHSTIFAGGGCNAFLYNLPLESYFNVLAALCPGGLLQVWRSEFNGDPPHGSQRPSMRIAVQGGGTGGDQRCCAGCKPWLFVFLSRAD